VLERKIAIAAKPETVFSFFTDPVKLARWKGMRAELDPRPGGLYRVNINGRDVARGEYVEIVPYSRIVITWGWEGENSPLPPARPRLKFHSLPMAKERLSIFSITNCRPNSMISMQRVGITFFRVW